MKNSYLKYDTITGNIYDAKGALVTTVVGFTPIEIEGTKSTTIDDMIKLKNAGFTAEEVIAIQKANIK